MDDKIAMDKLTDHDERDFIEKCIEEEDEERLSIEQALEHIHFKNSRKNCHDDELKESFSNQCALHFRCNLGQKLRILYNNYALLEEFDEQNTATESHYEEA